MVRANRQRVGRRQWLAFLAGPLLLIGALAALPGCQQNSFADRRLEKRERQFNYTLEVAGRELDRSPAATVEGIRRQIERRSAMSAANRDRVERYWHNRVDRWESRQDEYWRGLQRIFGGKVDQIETNAIIMFF
jgi:hypothetical protein